MSEPITISFVGTQELKDILKQWAARDERSISYVIRQILKQEIRRRAPEARKQIKHHP